MLTKVRTPKQLIAMRESGRMLASILELLRVKTTPGITPIDLSRIAAQELKALGGEPAFKGYHGFPDIICISVNNQVQHSIPRSVALKTGDIANYDFGVRYRGMITDAGITVGVGKITKEAQRLIDGTSLALENGIAAVKNGCRVGDISAAIEKTLRSYQLGIVQELVGHGVGEELHEEPNIPNYGKAGKGPTLISGMTIAIEPIANLGGEAIFEDNDGWTLWTKDGSLSAQFEHSVLVTDNGAEILTTL